MTRHDERAPYLQYGSGFSAADGWRNFDVSLTLRFERLPVLGRLFKKNRRRFPPNVEYGDIIKGLPVPPGSCKGIYCSHVLEHLALEDCRAALHQTFRLLQPGGIFRVVLPDLEHAMREYQKNPSSDAALTFMWETGLGYETRGRGLRAFLASWLGHGNHFWMWDYKALEQELETAGFVGMRRAQFRDSSDVRFLEVETNESRWTNALGIECGKPG